MGDMGCSCAKAQVTAHIATSKNSKRRKSWSGFPKTLECEKWVRFLYNCVAALRAPSFATSSSSSAPRFLIHIHTRFRRQSQTRSERWRRRGELETRRRRPPEPAVTMSGCRRSWGRRRSTGWWRRAFFLTTSPLNGGRPAVSPTQCLIPMKL